MCSIWFAGGWLLSTHVFRLRARERLFSGTASGLLLFILFSNLSAQVIPIPWAFWVASFLIFALGLLAAWHSSERPIFPLKDFAVWSQILTFCGLLILFSMINFGLAIFDDYTNLPLVSTIATGDVPPHFYLNPDQILDYHYGMHLFAASSVLVGGLYPWSALDIGKAFSIALTAIVSWLWFRRFMSKNLAWLWVGLLILFGGGARWILLLIPETTLQDIGANLQLMGSAVATGEDLLTLLRNPWNIEGDGPFPFPFAFVSGINRSLSFSLGGNGALPMMTLFTLLLLARRRWEPLQGVVFGLILASLALISEHSFLLAWGGILLAALLSWFSHRSSHRALQWGWTLVPGVILVPIMGGVLSQTAARGLAQLSGAPSESAIGLPAIALRWPPAILSGHLGPLSLTDPGQLLIALAEMGPVLFLAPWVTLYALEYIRSGKLFMAGLSMMALLGFVLLMFVQFSERDRDLVRVTSSALTIWMVLGLPYVWLAIRRGSKIVKYFISAGYAVAILGGLALLPSQLVAITQANPSYFVQYPDVLMSKKYWNMMEQDARILDPAFPYRPSTLFGRGTGPAYQTAYIQLPEFRALLSELDPIQIAQAGYAYIYIGRESWRDMSPEQRRAFQQPCVKLVSEQRDELGDFRRLFNVQTCQMGP